MAKAATLKINSTDYEVLAAVPPDGAMDLHDVVIRVLKHPKTGHVFIETETSGAQDAVFHRIDPNGCVRVDRSSL